MNSSVFRCASESGKTVVDLIPPSIHPSGTSYKWIWNVGLEHVVEIPDWILKHWLKLIQADKALGKDTLEHCFSGYKAEETPRRVALLREMLCFISADCCRDDWKRIVFSILSSGYSVAESIAYEWSITSDRYTGTDFSNLVRDYRNGVTGVQGAISLGSVYHYARLGGWNG